MKLIKIIIDHRKNKVFGMSEGKDTHRNVSEYRGFNAVGQEAKKVIDNKDLTVYDLRL